jgi:pyruvate dehydrogenase E2 component (dihydrolipoamide acetyltransferase)
MPIKILMPALSPTMTEGNLVKWHKKEGDRVKSGDLIAEIETDKATMEVEAVDEGIIGKILIPEASENVKVNSTIAVLLEKGESLGDLEGFITTDAPLLVKEEVIPDAAPVIVPERPLTDSSARIFATPLAKKIASDRGINITHVTGSGPYGRIVKDDVLSHAPKGASVVSGPSPFQDKPVSTMRKVIGKRLTESKQTVPHFYLTIECAIDSLLQTRKSLNENFPNTKLTVNDFAVKAVGMALQEVPEANAIWMGDSIRYFTHADVSIAVALEEGLITPIVRSVNLKNLVPLSAEIKELVRKAKEGKLKPEEFQGGAFTISNLGMYGIQQFGAIINPPQACILAVGAGVQKPVAVDGNIDVATLMTCTLSVDHRVVDGSVGATFLAAFKKYIENPALMLLGDL